MVALGTLVAALALLTSAQEPTDDAPCRLFGRLVDGDGAPVAGATVDPYGWAANNDRVLQHGMPQDWKDPAPVESDAEGRFEVRFVPPRAFQFTLKVEHADYGKVGWRWSSIAPGAELDLGTTVLERPGVIVGHIVDAEGGLLVEGWRVSAWHNWNVRDGDRSTQSSHANIDPGAGTFRFEDLPPGRVRISARSSAGTHLPDLWVETKAGELTEVEFVHRGPSESTRLVVTITTRPFYTFDPAEGTVRAIAADGSVHALVRAPGRSNDWHALDLPEGTYTVEIDDPRFASWRKEGVRCGTPVRASLVGSAAVELRVRDELADEPVTTYGLRVTFLGVNFSPNTFSIADDGSLAPPDGLFRGLVPGDLELELRAPDRAGQRVHVPDLAPGETRVVEVALGAALSLRGRVLSPAGQPAADVRVQLTSGEVAGHDGPQGAVTMMSNAQGMVRITYREAETRTDDQGGFVFEGLAPGAFALRALAGPTIRVDQVVQLDASSPEQVLTLPGTGTLVVEIALPDGVDVSKLEVLARPEHGAPLGFGGEEPTTPVSADGTCRIDDLPTGPAELELRVDRTTAAQAARGGRRRSGVDLGVARVVADEVIYFAADVRETLRGRLLVTLTTAERPSEQALPYLVAPDGTRHGVRGSRSTGRPPTGPLPIDAPGGRYRLLVENVEDGWSWTAPDPVELSPTGAAEVTLDVPLLARHLAAVDGAGEPLAATELTWWTTGLEPGVARAKTNGAGWLALELPAGAYSFARGDAPRRAVAVEWAAGEGALRATIPDGD